MIERFVWVIARPLSATRLVAPLEFTSNGKFHLCHWGVLVSDLSIEVLTTLLVESGKTPTTDDNDAVLGELWELTRVEGNIDTVNVTRPFRVSILKAKWMTFSAQRLGTTFMTSDEIRLKGVSQCQ